MATAQPNVTSKVTSHAVLSFVSFFIPTSRHTPYINLFKGLSRDLYLCITKNAKIELFYLCTRNGITHMPTLWKCLVSIHVFILILMLFIMNVLHMVKDWAISTGFCFMVIAAGWVIIRPDLFYNYLVK